jgi:hypothetical protein
MRFRVGVTLNRWSYLLGTDLSDVTAGPLTIDSNNQTLVTGIKQIELRDLALPLPLLFYGILGILPQT